MKLRVQFTAQLRTVVGHAEEDVELPERASLAELLGQLVARLVGGCDAIVSAAPLFAERLLLNREAVRQQKPLVDSAIYDFDARLMTIRPGTSACLACLYPESPPHWKREFPVFGAVASTVGALAALEIIKLVAGVGEPLDGLLTMDLRCMSFRTLAYPRRPDCAVCGSMGEG